METLYMVPPVDREATRESVEMFLEGSFRRPHLGQRRSQPMTVATMKAPKAISTDLPCSSCFFVHPARGQSFATGQWDSIMESLINV
jgi:hypothetical protein